MDDNNILDAIREAQLAICPPMYYVIDDVGCEPGKVLWLKSTVLCPETVVLHGSDLEAVKTGLPQRTLIPLKDFVPTSVDAMAIWPWQEKF